MKTMHKYYSQIGNEHHRFCAINQYAAQQIAQSRAEDIGEAVWTKPVRYQERHHGQYFWKYVA